MGQLRWCNISENWNSFNQNEFQQFDRIPWNSTVFYIGKQYMNTVPYFTNLVTEQNSSYIYIYIQLQNCRSTSTSTTSSQQLVYYQQQQRIYTVATAYIAIYIHTEVNMYCMCLHSIILQVVSTYLLQVFYTQTVVLTQAAT